MPDDPLQELFRCEHWACTLSHRACLRRQTETKWIASKREARPIYERCSSGECAQGNAVLAKHPEFESVKRHTKTAPRMDIVRAAEGGEMPKGYPRGEACKTCKSTGTRHKMGCAEAEESTRPTPQRLEWIVGAANRVKRESRASKMGLDEMGVAELLELRGQVQAELERREEELDEQLRRIRGLPKKSEVA